MDLTGKVRAARAASEQLANLTRERKDAALYAMADSLSAANNKVLSANQRDIATAEAEGMSAVFLEQLWLSPARFAGMVQRLRKIASLPDPVGEVVRSWQLPNGKQISQVRVPFGLAAVIYDAPDITAKFSGICLKSGNAALLRGSRLALNTNRAVVSALRAGLAFAEVAEDAIALVSGGKEITTELMHSRGLIDVLVPCGDANLVEAVLEESQIPVLNSDDYDINQFSIDIGAGVATEVSKKIQSRVSVELAEMTSTEYIVLAK